jgi:hypothetical protein
MNKNSSCFNTNLTLFKAIHFMSWGHDVENKKKLKQGWVIIEFMKDSSCQIQLALL